MSVLTEEQRLLLKDTIRHGAWGDADSTFLSEDGVCETDFMFGYCTNDAKKGGHFTGRAVSAMFRAIYRRLCPAKRNMVGRFVSHCRDWWGDGSGDMLFIRASHRKAFEEWARI